jgi:hypothetical protein
VYSQYFIEIKKKENRKGEGDVCISLFIFNIVYLVKIKLTVIFYEGLFDLSLNEPSFFKSTDCDGR